MLIRLLGDLMSPPRCAACAGPVVAGTRVFCAGCAASVERCPPASPDVAFGYYGGALATAIRRLKYEDSPYLARPLGALMRGACRAVGLRAELVIPVPLHPRRLAERGYNQSALLARHLADELGARLLVRVLVRVLDTSPQVELSSDRRRANLAQAFEIARAKAIEGRACTLVDDVSTTGATLSGCRQALMAAGARQVTSVVVARTSSSAQGISAELRADQAAKSRGALLRATSGCSFAP